MDIYGIISINNPFGNKMTVPNPSQYENIKYFEKEIKCETYHIIVRSRNDTDVFYEDQNVLIAIVGTTYIGNKEITAKEFAELYSKDKQRTITKIKGMFNLIIIEKMPLTVKIINDHFGLIPIFYCCNTDRLIFSTKLDFVKQNSGDTLNNLEYTAILEQIYFNYILGDKTYYKNIYMQNAASILEFIFTDFKIETRENIYWHLSELIGKIELSYDNALNRYTNEICEIVNSAVKNSQSPVLALTAGYDTRVNYAVLQKNLKNVPCFSYGIADSLDIKVPLLMKEKFGINYFPLYLSDDFEERFVDLATKAIFHSDGLADLEKANNEYAYSCLAEKYSDVVIGIFGSEFLKFPKFPNRLVSNRTLQYFFSVNDYDSTLDSHYLSKRLLDNFSKNTFHYIREKYLDKYDNLSVAQKVFLFFFYEGVRKYFMKELRISRYYLNVIVPYIDKVLVEILFKSELAHVSRLQTLRSSIFHRQKSHFIYSYIIEKYMPILLNIVTDRGYKPQYDLLLLSRLFIFPYYIRQKIRRQKPQYLYNVWAKPFIEKYINLLETSDILKPLFLNNRINTNIIDTEEFHRLLSIAVYLHGLSR